MYTGHSFIHASKIILFFNIPYQLINCVTLYICYCANKTMDVHLNNYHSINFIDKTVLIYFIRQN